MSNKKNISKLFYKDYFKEENEFNFDHVLGNKKPNDDAKKAIKLRNKEIKEVELVPIPRLGIVKDNNCLSFTIAYPGLVTGVGLVHDSKNLDGAYNLGMHFDYTWGMPVVYGSSVKGVLRQYFKDFYKGDSDKGDLDVEDLDVEDLMEDIFSGKVRNKSKDEKDNEGNVINRGYDNKSIYQRDIFFDAVVTKTYNKRLLEDDAITPHKDGPLKNPIPIAMLKIAPGCTIEFRFLLRDSMMMTAKDKLDLFKKILETVGVGAKTNVGYGKLQFQDDKK